MEEKDIIGYLALDSKVLVVGVRRVDGWSAYIGSVPGRLHREEYMEVARSGTKLPEKVAMAIFPGANNYGNYCR